MTSTQPIPSGQHSNGSDLFSLNLPASDASDAPAASFGRELRAARDARSLDLVACAQALKLPVRVLLQLERDQYEGIDSKIYLASYISKYGRYLGIDEAQIKLELARIQQAEPTLVATGGISRSRFLLDRYATAATYVVLTAVIAVPMIWLGVRGTMDRNVTHLAPLDAAPVAQQDTRPANAGSAETVAVVPAAVASAADGTLVAPPPSTGEQSLMASMAPFPNLDSSAAAPTTEPVSAPTASAATGTGSHSLNLSLETASWVEVVDHDGKRLEYGLLPAGSTKSYRSDSPLDVRIGNSSGAQVSIDGQSVGLDGYRHSNVAHFRVQVQDGKAFATNL